MQIIVGIQSVSKTVKQHQMMTLALQTSFHDVKSIVKLKGDYGLILSLRLPTKLTWLSAYGGPKQTLFFYRLMGAMVGPQRGAEDKVRERKREEKSRLRKSWQEVCWRVDGGELSSGNPCQPGMRSVE